MINERGVASFSIAVTWIIAFRSSINAAFSVLVGGFRPDQSRILNSSVVLTAAETDGPASIVTPVASRVSWDSSILSSILTLVSATWPFTPLILGLTSSVTESAVCDLDFMLGIFFPLL